MQPIHQPIHQPSQPLPTQQGERSTPATIDVHPGAGASNRSYRKPVLKRLGVLRSVTGSLPHLD